MNTCVITGGNGYIGSHMCRYLYEQNWKVHIIDNHSTSPQHNTHHFGEFHHLDIADRERVVPLLQKISPDFIFHFAARASIPEGEADPLLYYRDNTIKSLTFISNCIEANCRRLIFSSTCATYGNPKNDRIKEDDPQHPINSYGKSKLLIELELRDLAQKKLIDVAVLRYFNAIGCSKDQVLGENHSPETHLIPAMAIALLTDSPFVLYGTDYPTPDGTAIRDYIHVLDLLPAHLNAALCLKNSPGFVDFNLGSTKGYSVQEVLSAFKEVSNKPLNIVRQGRRAGDPDRLVADSQKAEKMLQFKRSYSLRDGIQHTLAYQTARKLSSTK